MKHMNPWHDIQPGTSDNCVAYIEVPKGSSVKYELDKETGLIKVDRMMYSSVYYPGDYGFIPQTMSEDKDPTDVIIINDFPLLPGVLINVRPIGLIEMIDGGERDEKIICVPTDDPRYKDVHDISDVAEHRIKEIENFFATYKLLQKKEVEIKSIQPAAAAKQAVKDGLALYAKEFNTTE